MSTAIRALVGVGALGGVAGGGLLLNNFLSTENIQSKLEANGFKLLTDSADNNAVWQSILTSYRATTNTLKFEGFNGGTTAVSSDTESLNTLKQKCKDLTGKKVSEDKKNKLYDQAKKWCIVPVSVSKLLEKEYTPLNTNKDDKEADKSIWTTKISEHKNTGNQKKKITSLKLAEGDRKEDEHLTQIKEQCKTIGETENHSDKFEEYQENYKDWCSK
ncbi:hypothetical protein A6V39_03680 [Candidatus Mycoplasma haematobovis]|uniref:Uncharacterized protein n=1 Tax=Candidatus Mycoplasma haematobovis TaxID=432608 RepID=A0A1A9QBZ3_9MOLU|nr:hypothetical protein [Candidatus Mycoplasma haematobovis]OAL09987.1 hypothetical protein A6V39_03680 [Candidatus Mycoplasma haematobovis]